jgi:predicted transcriptional regulator
VAAALGQIVAVGFITLGFLSFAFAGNFSGIWLAFIGLFLVDAARSAMLETTVKEGLRDVRPGDVMSRECMTVDRGTAVSDVAEQVLRTGRRCFFVTDDGHVAGMLTPQELRTVPRDRWDATAAGEAMKPVERFHRIDASESVAKAFDAIVQEDVNQLPVVEQGQIRGVISRDQLLRLVAARAELTM